MIIEFIFAMLALSALIALVIYIFDQPWKITDYELLIFIPFAMISAAMPWISGPWLLTSLVTYVNMIFLRLIAAGILYLFNAVIID